MIIDEIKEKYIERHNDGFRPLCWILINPKIEREMFLDGSLKKKENIDNTVSFKVEKGLIKRDKDSIVALVTIITKKVDTFLLL